ncbi:MAG: hypothetical protein Q3976_08370 [Corynebacterium sp.]|nr:hypothetical protein [Corynebacterium sp.]
MTKKLLSIGAISALSIAGLAACGITTDGTYTGVDEDTQFTLVLDTSKDSATFTAEEKDNTLELVGTLNADDEQITWDTANTNFASSVLDSLNDFWSNTSIGGDAASDLEGSTSNYDLDGDDLTLNLDGESIELSRED